MSVPLLSVLVLCIFLITEIRADVPAGATGGACKTSEPMCDSTNDSCLGGTCVTNVGGDCSSTPTGCTPSASCVSNKCTCVSPLVDSGFGQCMVPAKKLGGMCSVQEGNAACDDPNATCQPFFGNNGMCTCSPGFRASLQNTCVPDVSEGGGATLANCRSSPPFCDLAQDACVEGRCLTMVGGDCSSTPAGCTSGASCVSNVCTCTSPWTADATGQCERLQGGATKEQCRTSNPFCFNAQDVCYAGICVTMVGGDCSSTPDGCTVGASCVSNVCTCTSPWTADGNGQCLGNSRQVRGQCNSTEGTTACLDPNASCKVMVGDLGVCACREGYQPTLEATCVEINRRVGGGCELKNGRFACLDPNAECKAVNFTDGGGVCTCRDTHVPAPDGTCIEINKRLGGGCELKNGRFACSDPNAECKAVNFTDGGGVCTCRDTHVPALDGTCKLTPGSTTAECLPGGSCTSLNDTCIIDRCKTTIGRHCAANEQCVSEAYCNQTNLCNCFPPYYDQEGLCVAPAGLVFGPCNPRENGSCTDPHAVCLGHLNSAHCFCKDPYFHTSDLACKARPGALHGLCDDFMNICDDVNAECRVVGWSTTALCYCKDNYVETFNNRCLPRNQVGVRNGVCGLSPVCNNPEDRCSSERCKIPVGQDCSRDSGSCVFGATCVDNVCRCVNGLTNVEGLCFRILRTLGGSCDLRSRSDACEDSGAQCTATGAGLIGVCVCVNTQDTMDGTCSSVAISASLMLVVLAFMTSHLI